MPYVFEHLMRIWCHFSWLVVYLPLWKNMKVNGDDEIPTWIEKIKSSKPSTSWCPSQLQAASCVAPKGPQHGLPQRTLAALAALAVSASAQVQSLGPQGHPEDPEDPERGQSFSSSFFPGNAGIKGVFMIVFRCWTWFLSGVDPWF